MVISSGCPGFWGVRRRAFTLVEIAATFAMVMVIMAISIVSFASLTERTLEDEARSHLASAESMSLTFASIYGAFTPVAEELHAVVEAPDRVRVVSDDPATPNVLEGDSTSSGTVSLAVSEGGHLGLATVAVDGSCHTLSVPAPASNADRVEASHDKSTLCHGAIALPDGDPLSEPVPVAW